VALVLGVLPAKGAGRAVADYHPRWMGLWASRLMAFDRFNTTPATDKALERVACLQPNCWHVPRCVAVIGSSDPAVVVRRALIRYLFISVAAMEKALIAIMKEAGVPEEVRAKIEEKGWTKVRLFSKMFSSDSEAKQQGPERLGFKERPDQDVVAACIAMAWEDAQAAAKTMADAKAESASRSSVGAQPIKKELFNAMVDEWKTSHADEMPPIEERGSETFLGILHDAMSMDQVPIVSLKQRVSDVDQHTKLSSRLPRMDETRQGWISENFEQQFLRNTENSYREATTTWTTSILMTVGILTEKEKVQVKKHHLTRFLDKYFLKCGIISGITS